MRGRQAFGSSPSDRGKSSDSRIRFASDAMIILGINAHHADASAAIVVDGNLVAAVEEERFRRIKHWAGFPSASIRYCLAEAGVRLDHVDHIAVNRDPNARLWKRAKFVLAKRPSIKAIKRRLRNRAEIGSPDP